MTIVLDEVTKDYHTLIHFTPTLKERRGFAKSGVAMPDGSFYIRNVSDLSNAIKAVGRATPNAGESEVARRNAIRRHIIKRAKAGDINRPDMIPDTWNSDGSLKQSAILVEEVEEYLQHFGRKGMKWGEHRFGRDEGGGEGGYSKKSSGGSPGGSSRSARKAEAAKAKNAENIKKVDHQLSQMHDNLKNLKTNQKIMEGHLKRFGQEGRTIHDPEVMNAVLVHNSIVTNIKRQEAEIAATQKRRDKLAQLDHSAFADVDEFLAHFGRKGMKWGEHRFGRDEGGGEGGYSKHPAGKTPGGHGSSAPSRRQVKQAAKAVKNVEDANHQIKLMNDHLAVLKQNQKIMDGHLKKFGQQGKTLADPDVREALSIHNEITQNIHAQQREIDRMIKYRDEQKAKAATHDGLAATGEEFLAHFGRKGMKWGQHIFGDRSSGSSSPVHPDAARAATSLATARKHGSSALSTHDLRDLNNRLQQERQFKQLTATHESEGRKFVKQQLRQAAIQHGPRLIAKGAKWAASRYAGLPV